MMGRLKHDQGQLFYSFCLEDVVPEDHLVRKVAAVLELSWVLTHVHRSDDGLIAKLDVRIDTQIVCPGRIFRRSSLRPDENIVIAVFNAHQRCLPNRTCLIAPVSQHPRRARTQGGPPSPASAGRSFWGS
jgi:hypothetical protein